MGLRSILKKIKAQEKEIRILMLGLDNAGKTTAVKKFNGQDVNAISPTLGFNIISLAFLNFVLNIWDVGGQQTIRSYWRNYYEKTDALIWVVDSADRRRLQNCAEELHKLLKEEKLAGSSLLVLANKQDLPGALTIQEIARELRVEEFGNRHWRIQACSAVRGDGLVAGMKWVVQDVASRIFMLQ